MFELVGDRGGEPTITGPMPPIDTCSATSRTVQMPVWVGARDVLKRCTSGFAFDMLDDLIGIEA